MKTNQIMQGKVLISLVCLLCLLCVSNCRILKPNENENESYIYCRYAGWQDKPMYSCKFQLKPVVYPTGWDEIDIAFEQCFNTSFRVSRKEFRSIKNVTCKLTNNLEIEKRPKHYFGCYQIIIKNDSHDSCYYYLSKDESREYFKRLDELELENDSIHDKLKSMMQRL